MRKIKYNNKGVTLVELLIVLAIIGIVLQVGYSIFFIGNKSYNTSKNKGFAQQDVRIISTVIINELRTVREISSDLNDVSQKEYYSLGVEDRNLIKKRHNKDGEEVISIFSNKLSEMRIERLVAEEELLNIKIISQEDMGSINEQTYKLDFNILLENKPKYNEINNLLINDDVKLYYSKYE